MILFWNSVDSHLVNVLHKLYQQKSGSNSVIAARNHLSSTEKASMRTWLWLYICGIRYSLLSSLLQEKIKLETEGFEQRIGQFNLAPTELEALSQSVFLFFVGEQTWYIKLLVFALPTFLDELFLKFWIAFEQRGYISDSILLKAAFWVVPLKAWSKQRLY